MNSTRPELEAGEGGPCRHVRIAEDQPEYLPIDGCIVRDPHSQVLTTVLAFRPSAEERELLVGGADLYIGLLTNGGPMQPLMVLCGKEEASAVFNVRVAA